MKKLMWVLIIQCCSLIAIAQPGGNSERAGIHKTIDSLNKEMERVFNANDMKATAAFYSDDSEIVGANYRVLGRKALDDYWLSLKDKGRGWKLTVTEIGGVGDYLYQLGNSDLTYISNGKETKSVTNFVLIWKKQTDGTYKIFRDYLTDIEFKKSK